ncbi:MAG: ankyrin repeat domain-containing protein [Bdellovibrionia bacterium]
MIKHKVKYRVVGADRSKRKYSINLDDGASFQLTRELLQGTPAQEGSKPLCSMTIQNGALLVQAGVDQNDIVFNSKPVRESEVRPGDLVQVGEFSIEILECPHTVRSESNATQFLDVSEIFGNAAKTGEVARAPAATEPAPIEPTQAEPAPTVSHAARESSYSHTSYNPQSPVTTDSAPESSSSPVTDVGHTETPAESTAAAYSSLNELPALTETAESPSTPPAESAPDAKNQDRWASRSWETQDDAPTRVVASPAQAAARVRSSFQEKSYEDSYTHESHESQEAPARHRSRPSAHRDVERHAAHRQTKRVETHAAKKRPAETSATSFSESDFSHIAMSAGMAALGVAVSARVLLSGSSSPQGMTVACAALSSVPVVLGASLGLARMNEYLSTEAHLRDYARFLGWALICTIPWAYTQGASFPIAIFTTLLTTVLMSVAFVARFRPNMARFSAVGAGLSVAALTALVAQHHYSAEKMVAQESSPTEAPAADTTAAQNSALTAAAPAPGASLAPAAAPVAQVGATTPNAVQPQAPTTLAQQGAQTPNAATNPVIPSAVNDTIPPIPTHADTSAGLTARTPAAVDPSAKGIIDPLAHEEFFSAIKMGNLEVVKSLIDRKQVDPDFTLDKGSTPLIVASASGRIKVVDYLLRRRVNINAQDPHGTTALMWAVFKGHRDVAKFLISKGADTKVIRDDGDTAMDIARKWRQTEIVALLKEASNQEDGVMTKKSHSKVRRRRR